MGCDQQTVKARYLDEVDLLKFLAIIGMVLVHVYESWILRADGLEVGTGPIELFIEFFGGPVCAPIFMISLGIGVIYTRHNKPIDYIRRGLIIMVMGYVLNILREFIVVVLLNEPSQELIDALFSVDILQFAGLSFMFIGVLKGFGANRWHIFAIAVVMYAVSTYLGYLDITGMQGYLLGLFVFTDGVEVCFPIFGWFIYIAVGVLLGSYLHELTDHVKLYRCMFVAGFVVFTVVTAICLVTGVYLGDLFLGDNFYLQDIYALAWILGIDSMCIPAAYFVMSRWGTQRFKEISHYFGKNLNRIYILQWLIIGWMWGLTEYLDATIDVNLSAPLGIAVFAVASALAPAYSKGVDYFRRRFSEDCGQF